MRVVAIIQARMGSTRLPGKVLRDIEGETMLSRVIQRARRANLLDELVVATTIEAADDPIVDACENLQIAVYRGSELDVLDRYYQASTVYEANAVVRITSDCPLIDPSIIDQVVQAFKEQAPDYASTGLVRTFPRGLDTEVIAQSALARAWRDASKPYERVHVTPYIYQNPQLFKLLSIKSATDYSHYRWTVDTPEDLQFVQAVYARFTEKLFFTWHEILDLLKQEPDLKAMNQHIKQKSLEEC